MPPEPSSTSSVATGVATISAFFIAVLGVDYYSLVWATIGGMLSILFGEKTTRGRAIWTLVLSSLVGAALGTFFAETFTTNTRNSVMVFSIASAWAPRPIIVAMVNALVNRVNKLAGAPAGNDAPPPNL